jgi:hypothetical protein
VGFGDSIRRFFAKRRSPDLSELEAFLAERKGIEGYVEPRTATNPTTLLLVDRDGDHIRAAVREPEDAAAFCERHGIPVYDAQVIGYPSRMKGGPARGRGAAIPTEDFDEAFADIERRLREDGE